jgi:FkbM family methyltransferase
MSTKYFVLSRPANKAVHENDQNQIVFLNNTPTYLLPQINLEYYVGNGLFEAPLIEWTKQFCSPDKLMLDVGAHTGTYGLSLAHLCKEVHFFEPQKMTYYALCGGVALSNMQNATCHNVGLGSVDQVGPLTLKIVSNDGGGSSIHAPADKVLREETIEVRTLDSFGLENVGFIKMDVEENELFVLQGGRETLIKSGWPPILFESNYENPALFSYIHEMGYTIIQLSGCSNMYLASHQ